MEPVENNHKIFSSFEFNFPNWFLTEYANEFKVKQRIDSMCCYNLFLQYNLNKNP